MPTFKLLLSVFSLSVILVACHQSDAQNLSLQTKEKVVAAEIEKAKQSAANNQNAKPIQSSKRDLSSFGNFVAGKDYEILSTPVPIADNGKIEVVEFFWYGCNHCYSFEPIISSWKKTLANDVEFLPIPAVWAKNMEAHARMYYTIRAMGVEDQLHTPIFRVMNERRKRMSSLDEIATFMKEQGVDEEKFRKTYKAFGINSQVQQGMAKARAAGLRGTPELLVHGKYRVTGQMAGSQARMLTIANYLIEKERQNL